MTICKSNIDNYYCATSKIDIFIQIFMMDLAIDTPFGMDVPITLT